MNINSSLRRTVAVTNLAVMLFLSTGSSSFAQSFAQNHPRRAEVLQRDRNINNKINADKGQLHGHYRQLKQEDKSVHRQERQDKRMNGGHITKGEQRQLNHEENQINRQVRHDK
jgi:hypothetical protein